MAQAMPEQQALYALAQGLPRSNLPKAAQLEYDRLKPAWERGEITDWAPPGDSNPALLQPGLEAERQSVDPPGTTHTFQFRPGLHISVGVLGVALGAGGLIWPITGLFTHGFYQGASTGKVVLTFLLGVGWALALGWMGIRSFRVGAQVSGGKLIIRNEFRTRTVDAGDIRAITLQPKNFEGGAIWVAQVELADGRRIWIDDFACGRASKPPKPDRAAAVEEVRMLLGVGK
jgi:hypothetical protein